MNRFPKFMLATALFMGMFEVAQIAAQPEKFQSNSSGTFRVKVSEGSLYLEATEAPLVQIFQEIGKQANITIDSNIGPEEKVTIRFERGPLEDGIRQLAKNVSVFYTENPKDKTRRISRVVVVSEGKESVPVQSKTSPQPENVKEPAPQTATKKPAPQPERFKFEFDPGKFDGKEKAGKQP